MSTATRHLSAGAYLDEGFQQRILREVFYQRNRALAPSFGFDAVMVLTHAKRGRVLRIVRDVMLLAIVAFGFVNWPAMLPYLVIVLLGWQLAVYATAVVRDTVRSVRDSLTGQQQLRLDARWALLKLGLAIAAGVFVSYFGIQIASTMVGSSRSRGAEVEAVPGSWQLLLLALTVVIVAEGVYRGYLVSTLRSTTSEPAPSGRLAQVSADQARLDDSSAGLVVYDGFVPFIGSGIELRTWSFALRLTQADNGQELTVAPFDPKALTEWLQQYLLAIDHDGSEPWPPLSGLTVRDRIYVAGQEVPGPRPQHTMADLHRTIRYPTGPRRHYLACQVVGWHGELITTVYIHVAVQGKSLYVEFSTYALPPTRAEYHVFDRDGALVHLLRGIGRSLRELPLIVARVPLSIGAAVIDVLSQWSAVPADRSFGARFSIREHGTDLGVHNYFQYRDVVKNSKILERRLLGGLLTCLRSAGCDISEFQERTTTVLNQGVMITGGSGTVNIGAVGQNAGGSVGST